MKKTEWIRNLLFLQALVCVFSISTVVARFASAEEFLSFRFILFYCLEVMVLGVYAVFWQQAIKRFDISIAYANKAMVLLWGLLWSVLLFHEPVTPKRVAGVLVVIAGVIILNLPEKEDPV